MCTAHTSRSPHAHTTHVRQSAHICTHICGHTYTHPTCTCIPHGHAHSTHHMVDLCTHSTPVHEACTHVHKPCTHSWTSVLHCGPRCGQRHSHIASVSSPVSLLAAEFPPCKRSQCTAPPCLSWTPGIFLSCSVPAQCPCWEPVAPGALAEGLVTIRLVDPLAEASQPSKGWAPADKGLPLQRAGGDSRGGGFNHRYPLWLGWVSGLSPHCLGPSLSPCGTHGSSSPTRGRQTLPPSEPARGGQVAQLVR